MSAFSKFVWHPLLATLARFGTSSHAPTAAAAQASLGAIAKLGQDVQNDLKAGLTANSAAALGNDALRDLEDGTRAVIDAYIMGSLPPGVSSLAEGVANMGLDWTEQHLHDYIAALFHHAKSQAAAANDNGAEPEKQAA